jgi:hypothetical protein
VKGKSLEPQYCSDFRHTVPDLSKNPGTNTVIIPALVLGVAVNATIFSLVDNVLLWAYYSGRTTSFELHAAR